MKRFSYVWVVGVSALAWSQDPETPGDVDSLKTLAERASYAFGYQTGQRFYRMGSHPDLELFVRGMRDALEGRDGALSDEELRSSVEEYQRKMLEQIGERNLKEGQAFLAENRKKPGVVTLPSGLQYLVLEKGDGPTPRASDRVSVHYRGSRIDGFEFESSHRTGEPATYRVEGVIKGWTEALLRMPVGSKWKLFIPPDLGYGARQRGRYIRANSTLIFEIELLGIVGP